MRPLHVLIVVATILAAGLAAGLLMRGSGVVEGDPAMIESPRAAAGTGEPTPSPSASPSPSPSPPPSPEPSLLGAPWGSVPGLLQFRGNPTHTFYGTGPVPDDPEVLWRYPDTPMCSEEVIGETTKLWCGSGWTGQPVVWERPDGITEIIVGTYDRGIHFIDAATGEPTRPRFVTGDIIKGSVTLDPDGFPLLYSGSRDNYLRIIALDREVPTELWRLGANADRVWNNDWDGNPSIVDDILYEGGEDSWFYAIKLNRGRNAEGQVTVAPEILVQIPGFDASLFAEIGDRNVSIESSVVVHGERVYFANSGGRIVGVDVSNVERGEAPIVFDYRMGDDTDASLVVDAEGMLYATAEFERKTARAREVGQLVKLDPDADGDPRVWGVSIPPPSATPSDDGGAWATPALYGDHLYLTTHSGQLLVVDRHTGDTVHEEQIGYHEWSSPVVVEDPDGRPTLIVALCQEGGLRAYDLADPAAPTARWTLQVPTGACIESTPAVWGGGIYVGSRDGYIYGIGEPG